MRHLLLVSALLGAGLMPACAADALALLTAVRAYNSNSTSDFSYTLLTRSPSQT